MRRFIPLCALSLTLVIALGCVTEVPPIYAQDLALGAGFKAGFMCSAVFQGGRRPLDVTHEELQGVGWRLEQLPEPIVDYVHRAVFVAYPGGTVPRMAIYRDGLGTLLTPPGWTLADVDKLPHVAMPLPAGDPAQIPWPTGDLMADDPWPATVSRDRLEAVLDAAFTPGPTDQFTTIGVVVVYKDRIIAERYAPGWGVHVPYRTWSTGKSILSALIGILVRQGKLDVSAPAPIAQWKGRDDPRNAITIEHLLHMSSGLASDGTRTAKAYWGGINTAMEIVSKPLEVPPGTRWKYSNYDSLLLVLSMK